jgi:VanZ family protein
MVGAIIVLTLTPSPPEPDVFEGEDKLFHVGAYALLMLWFASIYLPGRRWAKTAVCLVIMGTALEGIQGLSGYRSFELLDMGANTAGVIIGWLLAYTRVSQGIGFIENRILGSPPGYGG